jgi:hypothetical protein
VAAAGEFFGEDSPCFFALRALRTMGDPAYSAQIVELAKEKMGALGMFARMEAMNLLGKFGDQSVMPIVRDAINLRVSREERRATVEAICKLRPPDGASLLVDNYLQPRALDPETGQISDRPNVHIFHIVVQGVVDFGDASVLDRLKALYAKYSEPTDHFAYRLDLAYAIAALGDAFGLNKLHEALGHEDAAVRRLAAKALGKLARSASLQPLTAAHAAEGEPSTFRAMRAALAALGAPADVLAQPAPPAPPVPEDTYGKPRYLHCTFDDCTTVESMERFVGLIEELAVQDVRWAPVMYVAALSRHDYDYVTLILQRCFDRGCEFENHTLYHNADGSRINARPPDELRLDCGGCINWLHGHIMGCDRIYRWRSGGSSFDRPGDVPLAREDSSALRNEAFWARNINYNWRAVPKASPDYFAPPYHFLGESNLVSTQVSGDLNWDYGADTVEEGVEAFVDSLDAWYFHQPERVFDISGHDWPKSPIPVRTGHEMHWEVLSGFLREVLLNRRDRYPQLYSMTALEIITINERGLTPEEILTQSVHLQNSPEF